MYIIKFLKNIQESIILLVAVLSPMSLHEMHQNNNKTRNYISWVFSFQFSSFSFHPFIKEWPRTTSYLSDWLDLTMCSPSYLSPTTTTKEKLSFHSISFSWLVGWLVVGALEYFFARSKDIWTVDLLVDKAFAITGNHFYAYF